MKSIEIRCLLVLVLALTVLTSTPQAQTNRRPDVSSEPLTADQVAIYRVVISNWAKDSPDKLNVASKTQPADQDEGRPKMENQRKMWRMGVVNSPCIIAPNPALQSPAQTVDLPGTDPAATPAALSRAAYRDREHRQLLGEYSQTEPGNGRGLQPASAL
jgi:hypothetical protein